MGATDRLRVGLAGLGRFGKLHASVLGDMPGVEIAAVCDPRADEVAAMLEHHPEAMGFNDFETMLDETTLDAVFIVTPEPLHAEQAIAALDQRTAVFVEKPLAMTAEDGARVIEAALATDTPLQVGFVLRFDTPHAQLKAEIARGGLGEVVSIRTKRNTSKSWFPDFGDRAHTMYETAIHDVDLLLWYTGSTVTRVHAVERNVSGMRYPDGCWALLEFASGAVGVLETSWLVPDGAPANVVTPAWRGTLDAEFEVVGSVGSSRIRLLDGPFSLWSPTFTAIPELGLWPEVTGSIAGALREEIAHFLHRVRTGAPESIASVADAQEGLRVIEAIVASAARGTAIDLATTV
jgi:predicted dehydrogenase